MKETKKNSKKLSLAKETIRQLDKKELTQVAGGRPTNTGLDCLSKDVC
jgi:hypothetical protein